MTLRYQVTLENLYYGDGTNPDGNAVALAMAAVHGVDNVAVEYLPGPTRPAGAPFAGEAGEAIAHIGDTVPDTLSLPGSCVRALHAISGGDRPEPFDFEIDWPQPSRCGARPFGDGTCVKEEGHHGLHVGPHGDTTGGADA